jgi:hemerythrin-like domain-containing protein
MLIVAFYFVGGYRMPELLDEIRDEHVSLLQVLGCLDRQVRILESGGHPDLDIVAAVLAYFEEFLDQHHHPKEDVLLARLRQRDPEAASLFDNFAEVHVELGASLRAFASAVRAALLEGELQRSAFARLAWRFIDLQRSHVAMEETNFLPAVERALTADEWSELAASFPECPDPMRGGPGEERYEYMRRDIVKWDADDFFGGGPF